MFFDFLFTTLANAGFKDLLDPDEPLESQIRRIAVLSDLRGRRQLHSIATARGAAGDYATMNCIKGALHSVGFLDCHRFEDP